MLDGGTAQASPGNTGTTINFQGRLLTNTGAVVADGSYNMEFKLYKNGPGNVGGDTGGTLLWTEDWVYGTGTPDNRVVVKNGYYSVNLGSITALPSAATLDESVLWLSMNIETTVGGASTAQCTGFSSGSPAACTGGDGEMLPMKAIGSTPYALNAANANQVNSYGLSNNFLALAAPSGIGAVNGAAGSVPGTVCYAVTATNSSGETVDANNSGTVTPGGTHMVTVSWSQVSGATGYKIYRNTSCAFTSGSLLLTTISSGSTVTYSDNATSTSPGVPPTTVTGSTVDLQAWNSQTASLLALQNSASTNLFTVDSSGNTYVAGVVTVAGGASQDFTTAAASTATGLTIQPGASSLATSTGPTLKLQGGNDSGGTAATGGTVAIQGGNATGGGGTQTGGNVTVDAGTGSTSNGSVGIGTVNDAAVTIGKTTGTGALTLGQSTQTESISIGNAAVASGKTQTITIGSGATSGNGIDTVTVGDINNGSSLSLYGGTNGVSVQAAATGTLSLGTTNANNLQLGAQGSTANADTVTVATSTGAAQIIQIGGTGATGASNSGTTVTSQAGQTSQSLANSGDTIKTYTNSATAFQIQNSSSSILFNADTSTTPNLLPENASNFESGQAWTTKGSGSSVTPDATTALYGSNSLKVQTSTTNNAGGQYAYALTASTNYSLSLYIKGNSSFNTISIGHQDISGTDIDCLTGQSVVTGGWIRFSCSFQAGATITSSNIYVKDTSQSHTFWIDGVQLEQATAATAFNLGGRLQLGGVVSAPVAVQTANNTTSAFAVQNAAGTQVLNVDTTNGRVAIGSGSSLAKLYVTASSQTALRVNNGTSGNLAEFSDTGNTVDQINYEGSILAGQASTFTGSGTVSTTGTTTVTGTTTNFLSSTKTGDTLTINGNICTVATVASNTSLTCTTTIPTNTNVSYTMTGAGNTDQVQLNANGEVGIGTSASTALTNALTVDGSALFQNDANSDSAMAVNNTDGESVFQTGTTQTIDGITNYIADSEFALGSGACPLTDWSFVGSPTSCAQNTAAANSYEADTSLKLVTTSTANQGVTTTAFTSTVTPAASSYYTVSFYAEQTTGTPLSGNNLEAVTAGDAATGTPCTISGQASNTLSSTGFEQVVCTIFYSSSSAITSLSLETTGSNLTADTIYFSNVQFQSAVSGGTVSATQLGQLNLRGVITSPVAMQNNANSSTALQIQNAAGSTIFNVNTNNTNIETSTGGVTSNTSTAPTNVNEVLQDTYAGTPGTTPCGTKCIYLGVAPHANGNVMVLTVAIANNTTTVTSIGGTDTGGVSNWVLVQSKNYATWTNGTYTGTTVYMYEGTVTSTACGTVCSNIQVNFSATDSVSTEIINNEFSSGLGANTVWGVTASGNATADSTGITAGGSTIYPVSFTSPSLTSGTTGGGLYYGYSFMSAATRVDPGTPGFHFYSTPVDGNVVGYSTNLEPNTSYSPVQLASAATYYDSVGAILTPTVDNSVGINGSTLVAGAASSAAFQVQNAVGAADLNVDTANNVVSVLTGNTGDIAPWQYIGDTTGNNTGIGNNTAVTANGYVFDVTGYDGSNGVSGNIYYTKASAGGPLGHMSSEANIPATHVEYQGVVAVNGYLYELGGSGNGTTTSTAVQYAPINADGTLGTWQTTTVLPQALGLAGASVVEANGYIYVLGGWYNNGGTPTISTAVYYGKVNADGSISSWTTSANSEPTGLRYASAVYSNGSILLIGGIPGTSGNAVATVYTMSVNAATGANGTICATTCTNNFANASLPANRAYTSAYVQNGYVYVVGGNTEDTTTGYNIQNTTYYGQVNSAGYISSWNTSAQQLPQSAMWQGGVALNGYLYVIGGIYLLGPTYSASMFYASTARIVANASLDLVGSTSADLADGGDPSSGSEGGSLTAGNTNIVGSLQVANQADFDQGVAVNGNVNVDGQSVFRPATNATNAFEIQNSSGFNVIQGDTSSNSGQGQLVLGAFGHNNGDLEFLNSGGTSDTESIVANTAPSNNYALTLPSTLASSSGLCLQSAAGATTSATTLQFSACGGGGGANTALSNLASVAINTGLNFQSTTAGTIGFSAAASTVGNTLTIDAQSAGGSGNAGGNLILQGGAATGAGTGGSVVVKPLTDSTAAFAVDASGGPTLVAADTTNGDLVVTSPATTAGGGTNGALTVTANSLTTGNGASIGTTSVLQTAGSLLNVSDSGTLATNNTSDTANLLNVSRSLTANVSSGGAPSFDAATYFGANGNNTASTSFSVASHLNRYLLAQVTELSGCDVPTTVTYAGANMTLLGSDIAGSSCVWIYGLTAPTTGSNTFSVTIPTFTDIGGAVDSFYNVNPTSPTGAFSSAIGTNTSPTVSATSVASQDVVDFMSDWYSGGCTTATPARTQALYQCLSGLTVPEEVGSSYFTATTTPTSMSWTGAQTPSIDWNDDAIVLKGTQGENVSGAVASIANSCSVTAGNCYDSTNVLSLSQSSSTATGTVLNITNSGSGDMLDLVAGSTTVAKVSGTGAALFANSADSGSAFAVQNATGANMFNISTSGLQILIGSGSSGDSSPVLLVLDNESGSATDPTGVTGAMYFNQTLNEYRCYYAEGWEPCRTQPIDTSYEIDEEFISGATASAASGIGNFNWASNTIGTCSAYSYGGGAGALAPSASRPGILKFTTGTTSGNGCALALSTLGASNTMVMGAGEDIKAAVAQGSIANPSEIMRVGLSGVVTAARPTAGGVWWESNVANNASWEYCYDNASSVATCASSGVPVNASTWVRLEIQIVSTSAINFYINGNETSLTSIGFATGAVAPSILCDASTAAAENCYADYYQLRADESAMR